MREVWLPGQGVRGLDFEAMPLTPAVLTIQSAPFGLWVRPGKNVILHLSLTPATQESLADLYLFFLPPGAPLRPQAPWQASLWIAPVTDLPVFSHPVTRTEPPGTYTWLAFLTRPGTLEVLGPVASASVTVEP